MPSEIVYTDNSRPILSVIIPSLDKNRGGNLDSLVRQLKNQSFNNIEIIISYNEKPNGHARNVGVQAAFANSKYFAFFDDDITLGNEDVLKNLIECLDNINIGLVGASQIPPKNSTVVQKWIAYDLSKAKFPIQSKLIDSEMATHAGMACRSDVWNDMNGESDSLITGTDTDLRDRLRDAGYRVVVAPRTWVFHPLPTSFFYVLKGACRNGWYQLDYRKIHGYQKGFFKPFIRVSSPTIFILSLLRELILLVPFIFLSKTYPYIGFRPLNSMFRFLMVLTYCFRSISNKKNA